MAHIAAVPAGRIHLLRVTCGDDCVRAPGKSLAPTVTVEGRKEDGNGDAMVVFICFYLVCGLEHGFYGVVFIVFSFFILIADWWFKPCFIFHSIWDIILPIDDFCSEWFKAPSRIGFFSKDDDLTIRTGDFIQMASF